MLLRPSRFVWLATVLQVRRLAEGESPRLPQRNSEDGISQQRPRHSCTGNRKQVHAVLVAVPPKPSSPATSPAMVGSNEPLGAIVPGSRCAVPATVRQVQNTRERRVQYASATDSRRQSAPAILVCETGSIATAWPEPNTSSVRCTEYPRASRPAPSSAGKGP